MRQLKKGRKYLKISWEKAPDVKRRVLRLIREVEIEYFKKSRIFCLRSENAKTRAIARIWGLGSVWQTTLEIPPAYIIEVISEKFDRLSEDEQDRVLLHELAHIPMNFSGALLPHRRGKGGFHDKLKRYERQFIWRKNK